MASPSPKRWSSRSTSFHTRASTRPLASASSSARYGAPLRVRRRSFFVTANTPSTVLSSASSAIVVTSRVYGELGVGTLAAMADVQPFRAVRYAGAAGSLADLVAPPYDAVDEGERAELYTRSPYNVIHVTLPETADEGARLYREWLAEGILERDGDAGAWIAVERYVGPDGVPRERHG